MEASIQYRQDTILLQPGTVSSKPVGGYTIFKFYVLNPSPPPPTTHTHVMRRFWLLNTCYKQTSNEFTRWESMNEFPDHTTRAEYLFIFISDYM
jgi:hypothetical protein